MRTTLIVALLATGGAAHAWEAATHAGLTERAAIASPLHKLLKERLGRPLGLYEPLKLLPSGGEDRELERRLERLDPEGGYVPDGGRQSALGWLAAGAVLEGVPAERNRHHFFDPRTGQGLDDVAYGDGLRTRLHAASTGVGSVRGVFTGAGFDGTGRPAPAWVTAPRDENDWGRARLLDELERAGSAATPEARSDALARALLSAGAILHVLEDAASPAHARNDYRVAFEQAGAPLERFAAAEYGRVAVPEPAEALPFQAERLTDLWKLAERTQQRFFSPGTLPPTGRYPAPVAEPGRPAAAYVSGAVPHLVAYRRAGDRLEWILDDAVHRDYAEALLPEAGRAATRALELLFRGRLEVAALVGQRASIKVTVRELPLGAGTLTVYADDEARGRKKVAEQAVTRAAPGDALKSLELPAWARHVAVVFRGVDSLGEPLVIVQEHPLK